MRVAFGAIVIVVQLNIPFVGKVNVVFVVMFIGPSTPVLPELKVYWPWLFKAPPLPIRQARSAHLSMG